MAPLVASIRSATAILQLASTTNKMRLAARRTRTFSRRSLFLRARASSDVFTIFLVGGGSAQGGVKGEVGDFAFGMRA